MALYINTRRKYVYLLAIFLIIGLYMLLRNGNCISITYTRYPSSSNYFLTEEEYNQIGFLVNSTLCKIPAIQPWDPSVLPFINKVPPISCKNTARAWTYVKKSTIVLNVTAIESNGYSLSTVYCCYRTIHRNDKLKNLDGQGTYSRVVDSRILFSKTCTPMSEITEPSSEFVFVSCEPKYSEWYYNERLMNSKAVYRNYHALVPKILPSPSIRRKIKYWKDKDNHSGSGSLKTRPPNVIMLGLDATSRLNFRRSMPRTIKFLKQIRSHEMLGYTKVGENTWPNLVALMTGFDDTDFQRVCFYSTQTKLDNCPFIWRRFSEANYLTSEIQDSPRRNSWNFEKTGFVEPPTDFYFRPFIVAVHLDKGFYPERVECIGDQTVENSIWNYVENIVEFGRKEKTPVFVNVWLTQLAHDSLNSLQFGDDDLADMLRRLSGSGSLENTILVIVGDHGYRYGGIRETLIGYYEDKLPVLWISLPPSIRKNLPKWEAALSQNQRRLAVPFDVYTTLNHILDQFANYTTEIPGKTKGGTEIKRDVGTSLFSPLQVERSCGEAGIPDSYCPCNFPIRLSVEDTRIQEAASASVDYLNSKLPSQCSRLILGQVKGGANLNKLRKKNSEEILVEFVTSPGNFVLEATVTRTVEGKYSVKKNVQRLSKFQTEVYCISDPAIQLYCYCL